MDWKFFLQLIATFLVAAFGWWAAHWFTSRRDLNNERRKIVVQLLLEAYRKLENASNRNETPWGDIESAIADIQLLGSLRQATLAMEFATLMGENRTASMDTLLLELRDSLRLELKLPPISNKKIIFFRFVKK